MIGSKQSTIELIAVLLSLTTLQCMIPQATAVCTSDTINKCLTVPVTSFDMFFNITVEQYKTICDKVDEAPDCLKKEGCTKNDTLGRNAFGVMDGLDYFCNDAKSVLKKSQQCLTSAQGYFSQCKTTYMDIIETLNSTNVTSPKKNVTQTICVALNDLFECLNNGVMDYCDADMERVFVVYMMKAFPTGVIFDGCLIDLTIFNGTKPSTKPSPKPPMQPTTRSRP
jgi:hypothetical protein